MPILCFKSGTKQARIHADRGEGDFTVKPKIFCIIEDDRSNIGLSKALLFYEMYLYVLGRVELANGTVGSKNQPRKHGEKVRTRDLKAKSNFL